MPGTAQGAAKAVATIKERNPDHFKKAGALGGRNGRGPGYRGGFAHPNADPRTAGAKGGRVSKRNKATKEVK